jgi:predicted AlkP superfamily pyrophosphatase or phosphodiesterase
VCLASIATGGHADVHGIPHLVWWNREDQRLVEYGSSFGALVASGLARGLRDSIVNLNEHHLLRSAETIFELLEDAGLTTAAINITTYRGRNRHTSAIPGFPPVYGPSGSSTTASTSRIAPARRSHSGRPFETRAGGSIDAYAGARSVAGLDDATLSTCLSSIFPTTDYASHAVGPTPRTSRSHVLMQRLPHLSSAAGGRDEFLERYAVVLCSDHGQSQKSNR